MTPPNKQSLVPALRSLLEEEARSEHPTPERLIDYQSGWLTAEERGRIEAHLSACPECKELLADLAAFEAHVPAAEAKPDLAAKAAWKRLREQLPQPQSVPVPEDSKIRLVPKLSSKEKKGAWWWRPQTAYALAAGLFCGVIGLTLWGMSLHQRLAEQKKPQVNTVIVDLYPADEGTRGPTEDSTASSQLRLVLTLHLLEGDGPFDVEISDDQKKTVWHDQGLQKTPQGDFTIEIPDRFLQAGQYDLRVYAAGDRHEAPVKEYPLKIASGS